MKKLIFLLTMTLSGMSQSYAQEIAKSNLVDQPDWGPSGVAYAENYYIPDLNMYYNVPKRIYVYQRNGRCYTGTETSNSYQYSGTWFVSDKLPMACSGYNLYRAYKVVINTPEPWRNHSYYLSHYWSYRSRTDQVAIRDSREPRAFQTNEYAGYLIKERCKATKVKKVHKRGKCEYKEKVDYVD